MAQYNVASWFHILLFLLYPGFYADCASAQAAIRGRKTFGVDTAEAAPVGLSTTSGCYDGCNNCGNTGYGYHEGEDGSSYDSGGYRRSNGGGRYSNGGVIVGGDRGGVGSIGSGQARGFGSGTGYKWSSSSRPGYGSVGKGDMGGNGNYGGNGP